MQKRIRHNRRSNVDRARAAWLEGAGKARRVGYGRRPHTSRRYICAAHSFLPASGIRTHAGQMPVRHAEGISMGVAVIRIFQGEHLEALPRLIPELHGRPGTPADVSGVRFLSVELTQESPRTER